MTALIRFRRPEYESHGRKIERLDAFVEAFLDAIEKNP